MPAKPSLNPLPDPLRSEPSYPVGLRIVRVAGGAAEVLHAAFFMHEYPRRARCTDATRVCPPDPLLGRHPPAARSVGAISAPRRDLNPHDGNHLALLQRSASPLHTFPQLFPLLPLLPSPLDSALRLRLSLACPLLLSLARIGLLELSKSFLDPFGNRRVSFSGLTSDINIDCLIGESNAGSLIWPQAATKMPFGKGFPNPHALPPQSA